MNKNFSLVIFFIVLIQTSILSAPISYRPVQVKQPNGVVLNLYQSGDEFYSWLHDKDYYTILPDPSTGYYTYAVIKDKKLSPSNYIVGEISPSLLPIEKGINIFPEAATQAASQFKLGKKTIINKVTGKFFNLVIFVKMQDAWNYKRDIPFFEGAYNSNPNSIKEYFKEASFGQLDLESKIYTKVGDTIIFFQDPHTTNYYRNYDPVLSPEGYKPEEREERERELFVNAVIFAKQFIGPDVNLDGDNDGCIDNICLVIFNDTRYWSGIMWPHKSFNTLLEINGKKTKNYNIFIEEQDHVLNTTEEHEILHSFGLPDLYRGCGDNSMKPVGPWDIMANGLGHCLMYCKSRLGWIDDIPLINKSGRYTIKPNTEKYGSVYRINSPRNPNEYFVLEYRKQSGNFEYRLPGSGLLIYRIKADAEFSNLSGPPDHIYVYRPDGTLINNGFIGKATFSNAAGKTFINDSTNPNGFLSDGFAGGLDISNIIMTDRDITFDVNIKNEAEIKFDKEYICGQKEFDWIDIKNSGTKITDWVNGYITGEGAREDGYTASSIPLGFDFYFYGETFSNIFAGINGLVSFTFQHLNGSENTYSGEQIDPGTYIKNLSWPGNMKFPNSIAIAYNDFSLAKIIGGGDIYYQTIGNKFILSYENIKMKSAASDSTSSFQMVLDASDSSITINYKNFGSEAIAKSIKTGIQKNAVKGIGYYDPERFNERPLTNNNSICFKPDPVYVSESYKIKKVDYSWINISSTGKEITKWQNGPHSFGEYAKYFGYSAESIPLGFDFVYYGKQFRSLYVGILGLVSFTHKYLNYILPNYDIDGNSTGAIQYGIFDFPYSIAINYMSLTLWKGEPHGNGRVLYQTIGKKFILSYENIGLGTVQIDTTSCFQMVLNGEDNTIQLNYKKIGTKEARELLRVGIKKDYLTEMTYVNQGSPKENLISDNTSLLIIPGKFNTIDSLTAVRPMNSHLPSAFELKQNYPNPFNPATSIKYQLPKLSRVTISVYNLLGQKIKTLVDEVKSAGYYEAKWNGDSDYAGKVSSGIYLLRMEAGDYIGSKKMLLIK